MKVCSVRLLTVASLDFCLPPSVTVGLSHSLSKFILLSGAGFKGLSPGISSPTKSKQCTNKSPLLPFLGLTVHPSLLLSLTPPRPLLLESQILHFISVSHHWSLLHPTVTDSTLCLLPDFSIPLGFLLDPPGLSTLWSQRVTEKFLLSASDFLSLY